MSKTIEDIRKELDSKIPRDAVSTRSSGFGPALSYLTGHYVIDRLNQIFGAENWQKEVRLTKTFEGNVEFKNPKTGQLEERPYVSYMAEVCLTVRFPGGIIKRTEDAGFGDGSDKNPGKAHELAIKEAITDGLKRNAKDLGMSMGLALYSKDQENVEDEKATNKASDGHTATKAILETTSGSSNGISSSVVPKRIGTQQPSSADSNSTLRTAVKSAASVLKAQGKLSTEEFRKEFIVPGKLEEVPPKRLQEIYDSLKTKYPELGLGK